MKNLLKLFEGKKTYLIVIAGALVFILNNLGYIDADLTNQIYVLLGITGTATMRSAIK